MAAVSVRASIAVPQPIVGVAAMHGVSRAAFSRKTGIARREIAAVWDGVQLPNERHVALAVAVLGVPADQLFRPGRAPERAEPPARGGARR